MLPEPRLGLHFGTTPEFWLNLQTDHDLRLFRRGKIKAITKQVKPLAMCGVTRLVDCEKPFLERRWRSSCGCAAHAKCEG